MSTELDPRLRGGDVKNELHSRTMWVVPSQRFLEIPEDPSENEFLDVAVESRADAIVSGDHHLLSLKKFKGILILTPAEFLSA